MANVITGCRILCSIGLLFLPTFSPAFYIVYLVAGFSDMIDGTVARRTNTASDFGSRLDTVADLVFVFACLVKLLPELTVPPWVIFWVAIIAVIKIMNIVLTYVKKKRLLAEHVIANKIAGFLLFVFPITLPFIDLRYGAVIVCAVATFAAVQEGHSVFVTQAHRRKPA